MTTASMDQPNSISPPARGSAAHHGAALVLRVLAVAALGLSAYVHLHLADRYGYPGTIDGTQLFYAQGAVAAAVALALLVTGNPWLWRLAAAVGLVSLIAVLVSRYADLSAIGPLPNMTDHTWQPTPEKPLSAIAEGAVVVLWAAYEAFRQSRRVAAAPPPAGS